MLTSELSDILKTIAFVNNNTFTISRTAMIIIGGFVSIAEGGLNSVEIFGCPDEQSNGKGILMADFPVSME